MLSAWRLTHPFSQQTYEESLLPIFKTVFGRLGIKTPYYMVPKPKSFNLKKFLNSQAPVRASLGSAKLWLKALPWDIPDPRFPDTILMH